MQITPLPPAISATPSAETIAKTAAPVQAQAVKPLLQRAVDPAGKSEGGNQLRSKSEKAKGDPQNSSNRGNALNIRV